MFKKAMLRGFIGLPIGVFISTTIALIFSIMWGTFLPTSAQLIEISGTQLNAALIQYISSCILGFTCASFSVIFEVENWSITKQTIIHSICMFISIFVVAILNHWVSMNFLSILIFIAIWIFIYIIIWIALYTYWKNKILQINRRLQNK